MSRLSAVPFAAAVLAALALLPAAQAQVLPVADLSIDGIPSTPVIVDQTVAVIPVKVTLSLANYVCVAAGTVTFPVDLAANFNGTTTDAAAVVSPARLLFQVGTGVVTGYTQEQEASLVVNRTANIGQPSDPYSGTVTATLGTPATGCAGASATPPSATAAKDFRVQFRVPPGVRPSDDGQAVPSVGFGIAALALAALGLVLRRR